MKKYNPELPTLIFDLDGTIVDNFRVNWKIIYDKHMKKINKQIGSLDDFYEVLRENNLKDLFLKYKINPISFLFDKIKLKKEFILTTQSVELFPNTDSVLKDLSKDYNLIILSSAYKEVLKNFVKKFDLKDLFVEIVGGVSFFKKTSKIKKTIKKYSISLDNCIYIGDEVRDYLACEKIGLKCISVSYGFNSKRLLKEYNDFIIDDICDLKKEIKKILNNK